MGWQRVEHCLAIKQQQTTSYLYYFKLVTEQEFYAQNYENNITLIILFILHNNPIMKVKWSESHSVMSDSLRLHGLYSPPNSPGQNTRVGSLSHLQGIFPTRGSNPALPHCRWILYQLSHKGKPRILEYVAYPFSSGSSLPRNWTGASCIADRFITNWATRDDHHHHGHHELSCCSSCLVDTQSVSPFLISLGRFWFPLFFPLWALW